MKTPTESWLLNCNHLPTELFLAKLPNSFWRDYQKPSQSYIETHYKRENYWFLETIQLEYVGIRVISWITLKNGTLYLPQSSVHQGIYPGTIPLNWAKWILEQLEVPLNL